MNLHPHVRKPLLAAVLAAFTASAWAAYEYNSSYVPAVVVSHELVTAPQGAQGEIGLESNESVVAVEERATQPAAEASAPRVEAPAAAPVAQLPTEPAITIEKPRLTADQRIQADVMEMLASNPTLSGKIGVVSQDRVVTLTGYTLTSGQAWRAGRDAGRIEGVRHVVNEIRPRVGGITS